jgi:DNA mismatch endonuclease (patch repair protein)
MKKKFDKTYIRDGRAPIPEKESISRLMSANKAKNTKPELILRNGLWSLGIRGYRLDWKKVPGRPDIAFPKRKIAIFVNGCFWHRCKICSPSTPRTNPEYWNQKFNRNIERDKRTAIQLAELGWKVIIVWECELKKDCKRVLKKVIDDL